jgi:ribosomal protein L15
VFTETADVKFNTVNINTRLGKFGNTTTTRFRTAFVKILNLGKRKKLVEMQYHTTLKVKWEDQNTHTRTGKFEKITARVKIYKQTVIVDKGSGHASVGMGG